MRFKVLSNLHFESGWLLVGLLQSFIRLLQDFRYAGRLTVEPRTLP